MNGEVATRAAACSDAGAAARLQTASALYPAPAPTHAPLRTLLLLPPQVPAWLLAFAQLAAADPWLALAVLPTADAATAPMPPPSPALRRYLALDAARRRHAADSDPLRPRPLAGCAGIAGLVHAPVLAVDGAKGHLREAVRALRPDLILMLGAARWADAVADCARAGCWWLDASLGDAGYAGLSLLPPLLAGHGATCLQLEALADGDAEATALAASWSATCLNSFALQRERAFAKLPALLLRAVRRIAAGADAPSPRRSACLRLTPTPLPRAAGARALALAVARHVRKRLRRAGPEEAWHLAVRRGDAPLDPQRPHVGAVEHLYAAPGRAWADPCIVDHDGRRLVFAEEFPEGAGKGTIVCLALSGAGGAQRLGVALDEPFHLSYPQVFRWRGDWYMTVESGAARRASVYRAEAFPLRWTREADLLVDRVCVDPTLRFHEGRWYLFANVSESGGSTWDELFLFVGDSPLGPFRPHPANPIVSDVRCARSAGRLFHHQGRLVRPAQNCAPRYGAAIAFREVTALTPTAYAERPLGRLAPWMREADGCHTYSAIAGVELLDLRLRRGRTRGATS